MALFGNICGLLAASLILVMPAIAACPKSSVLVGVRVLKPEISVSQGADLSDHFGDVEAVFRAKYDLKMEEFDGCTALKSVRAEIGYDFDIRIDGRFNEGSCEYNAVLRHEQDHINIYMATLRDFAAEFEKALKSAAKSARAEDIKSDPELVMVLRKIEAEAGVRNRNLDKNPHSDHLAECK